eukprot:890750-Ditylum_brightwellii.AAC.1
MFEQVTSNRGKKKVVKREYNAPYLPTGCTPVPMSDNSNPGWEWDEPDHQSGSDPMPPDDDELFPPSSRGCLDAGKLHKLGMPRKIIDEND